MRDSIIECLHKHPGYSEKELSDPPSLWMNDVHCLTATKLGLKDFEHLKIFPALGTSADRYHGIDFIIVYTDPQTGEEVFVTADLSANTLKSDTSYKADIIITPTGAAADPLYYDFFGKESFSVPERSHQSKDEDRKDQLKQREKLAELIANVIKSKLNIGDEHYTNLYDTILPSKFRRDIHSAVENLIGEHLRHTA